MCILRVCGTDFDPRAFLQQSRLEAYEVWNEGEPQCAGSKLLGKTHRSAGFKTEVSVKDFTDLEGQIADAERYLETYADELRALLMTPGVTQVCIDFPFSSPDSEERPYVESIYLPPRLLMLAGGLGIGLEVSVYSPDLEST